MKINVICVHCHDGLLSIGDPICAQCKAVNNYAAVGALASIRVCLPDGRSSEVWLEPSAVSAFLAGVEVVFDGIHDDEAEGLGLAGADVAAAWKAGTTISKDLYSEGGE